MRDDELTVSILFSHKKHQNLVTNDKENVSWGGIFFCEMGNFAHFFRRLRKKSQKVRALITNFRRLGKKTRRSRQKRSQRQKML